jgi:hypothetical protein
MGTPKKTLGAGIAMTQSKQELLRLCDEVGGMNVEGLDMNQCVLIDRLILGVRKSLLTAPQEGYVPDGYALVSTERLRQLASTDPFNAPKGAAMEMKVWAEQALVEHDALRSRDSWVVPNDEQVRTAMQDCWDEWCADTGCYPDDFTIHPRKLLSFTAGPWAAHVAERLRSGLAASPPIPAQAGGVQERQHIESEYCWCSPTLDYVAENGNKVWVHHEPT